MVLRIEQIEDKEIWERFIKSCSEYTFFHSWNWGEFSMAMGHKIWRLGIYELSSAESSEDPRSSDDQKLIGVALIVGIEAKRGRFLFVPHGPIMRSTKSQARQPKADPPLAENPKQISNSKFQIINKLILRFKEIARAEKYNFIRMSPLIERSEENEKLFKELGFRKAPIHMHAESTLLLDITKSEDELLKNMRKTTRYLIRRMEKEGVEIEIENPPIAEHFLKLQEKVAERKHFIVFSKKQIKNEIEVFSPNGELVVFNAKYNGKVLASALIIYYGYRAFYYQSASCSEDKNISAPYLLVWRAIQEAKKRDCQVFDFYGASPADKPNHPWAGPTLFKQGFGSCRVDYLPAQDLPLNWKYWITFTIEILRRIKRGF